VDKIRDTFCPLFMCTIQCIFSKFILTLKYDWSKLFIYQLLDEAEHGDM